MTVPDKALDKLAPRGGWSADWPDVLARAGVRPRVATRRRVVLAFAVAAAVLVPLAALAGGGDWWFLKWGAAPAPTAAPRVVATGEWDGHGWQLVAYPSATDGLCFSITPAGTTENGSGAALACAPFVGVGTKGGEPELPITFLAGGATTELPAYVAGPVVAGATTVEIRFANGRILKAATFDGDHPIDGVRFYALPLPGSVPAPKPGTPAIDWLAGIDAHGTVVACLAPARARDGISPPSDCR
jgi:hypothetical protein